MKERSTEEKVLTGRKKGFNQFPNSGPAICNSSV
jgi:hypothetical protein